jgi:hypothetical protein
VLGVEAELRHARVEHVEALLALAAADDLADAGRQHVHRRDGLAVVVQAHVEGLDLLRGSSSPPPAGRRAARSGSARARSAGPGPIRTGNSNFSPASQQRDRLGVVDALERRVDEGLEPRDAPFSTRSAKKAMSSARSSSTRGTGTSGSASARSASSQVGEGDLRLDHPELGEVAAGVRVLGAEGRAEGVDLATAPGSRPRR